jgi:MFS transporter, UMF1 family
MRHMSIPKPVWHWAFYDFANSSYVLIYQTYLLPIYFSAILIAHGFSLKAWGISNGISTVLGIILAIALGRYSDRHRRLDVFKVLMWLTFFGMLALTAAVAWRENAVFYLFIVTNAFFIATISISDSMLPYLAPNEDAYEYSGFAWGLGYMGGVVSLLVVIVLQQLLPAYSPFLFLSVALFYILFSLYAVSGLKDVTLNEPAVSEVKHYITSKQRALLFFGYWLISESITVIILFFSIFASRELGYSTMRIGLSLLALQIVAFPTTWLGGRLTKTYHTLPLLGLSILCWVVVIILMVTTKNPIAFVLAILLAGTALGNSQSFLRAQYSTLIDPSESGFQFGLYAFISQAAVSVGPIIYGMASDQLQSQKIPLIGLAVLMGLGFICIRHVIHQVHIPRIANING